ncbi:protein-methionine-sulfoxide reductase heme-binding subunit MsrQ [Iodidimonas muriae]|uniref:Protein-methionine-sulfoxide reductase heme-binding subunit MsrQ n=1 Tax=Iodidimonas muriae TaxID=261467 RepID=A0ABQ2L7U5_9PROT|nr:protein-methionine-sulfoxide reductase heme-binding subunit MsrQ [Iodidimonas muriae]GGO04027.1 protein-methionine-sulfoxide reductase heme-binding subunit MsrQ [Iodidimonas muriae]
MTTAQIRIFGKPILFFMLSLPALWLTVQWALYFSGEPNGLGINPQEISNRFSGRWTLRMLILALAVSPFAALINKPWPLMFRRMVGLFAFFYVTVHLGSYLGLDLALDFSALWRDIMERVYILFGVGAFLCLLPLAATSTKGWIKRLGAPRWKALHRLVYMAGLLAALHFLFLVKGNRLEPKIYAAIIAALLLWRLYRSLGSGPIKFGDSHLL